MKEKLKSVSSGLDKKYKSVTVITAQLQNQELASRKPRALFDPVGKAIFTSSVSKNGEVYTPEISSTKGTSVHAKNIMWTKQVCNRKVRDFAMALQARMISRKMITKIIINDEPWGRCFSFEVHFLMKTKHVSDETSSIFSSKIRKQ